MNRFAVGLILVVVLVSPAGADQVSLSDRKLISSSIARYLDKQEYGATNPFNTRAVELGAAAGVQDLALADWRSSDRKLHGQVFLYAACHTWNILAVSVGRKFSSSNLLDQWKRHETRFPMTLSTETAEKLVSELAQLESQHIAFLPPGRPGGC